MPAPLIAGGIGVAKAVTGLVNRDKARKEAKELEATRPKYSIDNIFQQNLDLAESEASTGLSANAENAYNLLQDKQFSSSLDAILKSGGTATNVAEVYGQGQEGRLRLAQLSDQTRLSKINNLMRSRESLAGERDKEFEFNEWRPWADKAQANAEARRGADEQIWSGLQTAGSSAMQYFDQRDQQKRYDDYLKTVGGNTGRSASTATYTPPSRPNVVLPTSSANTGMLPKYQSHWSMEQEGNTLNEILNMAI
jgi:hypothetical protein